MTKTSKQPSFGLATEDEMLRLKDMKIGYERDKLLKDIANRSKKSKGKK